MVIDFATQQHLPEIFSTNHTHHRSSSSSSSSLSSTHKRNSPTTNPTSSNNTMTNGHRPMTDELSKKAQQILGRAPDVVDYCRQPSIDFSAQHGPRLDIKLSQSRTNTHQSSSITTSNQTIIKNRHIELVQQLVPLILKLVAPTTFTKLPETISRRSKNTNNTIENRQTHSALYDDMNLNLSDDENEEAEDDEADDKKPNENQIKNQHTDSDDQVPIHSDTENDDEINRTNPHTLSLSDFITGKHSPVESSTDIRKRSLSPQIPAQEIKQNKRKEELIKSFSSCVNIPIDVKQPTLPITIPTYLFSNQSNKTDDEQIIEKSQKTSKRYANGTIKQDTNTQMIDNSNTTNGTQQKKNKTSHIYKQEPAISSTTIRIKEEPNITSHIVTSNEILSTGNTITITPMTDQPKKKPTANVRPLLQTTTIDNSSSINNNSNVLSTSDRLTTATNASTKSYYNNLKNMSTKELNSLAREKKKQADGEKRTFEDIKQSMSLYLESVCYFIQCAHDEPILEQRTSLLAATISMLQHLAFNYEKMFHISTIQSNDSLHKIRQTFLLINYWLQSFIYQLQYNANLPILERCAHQVTEYFSHSKSPADTNHNFIYEFSKYMLHSYNSNYYWNKADRLKREEPLKKFNEQLLRQNQNRRLARDDTTLDFLLYIFDAIDLLRLTVI
ncbi:unnamed protein product [Rotaria sp. Silwood1]|nr:unnamed protein product [Rotaria sp. Silwood1]CAF3518480.1 unnamed protein product [Rotaria sp. Silwood1]CAF4934437.1 unnamed protein product [Rotaria sp. Silwood1]